MSNKYFLIAIFLVSLALLAYIWPVGANQLFDKVNLNYRLPEKPFTLGLDLLGGAHLLYQADLSKVPDSEREDAMNGIRDVIERRVNLFGVSEPLVQVSGGDRLIIELAGIQDINTAIQLIGGTPFLEFKEEKPDFQAILEAQNQGQRLDEDPYQPSGLNGSHLSRAQLVFDPSTGVPQVSLQLNDEGKDLFSELTGRNIGKTIAIYLDGILISFPVVEAQISDGNAIISGRFTPQEAKLLSTRLNSGALPVPIALISQQTVGASLGAESLSASLKAGIYGLLLVAVFMILFYRLPGLLAVVALLIYIIIVLAIYKVFPVTLTLAGIAGFILSLGMSVDANVLIFSRMREELKAGKSLVSSINEGFSRAWLSIRDSHVTTIISAIALYIFTTSIVKGFALTLGIGVVVSLFSAVMVTHALLKLFSGQFFEKRKWLFK